MNLWLRVTQLIRCPWSLHSDGCFCEVSSLFRPPAPLPESSESEENCHSLLLPYLPTRVPAYLLLFCWWEWESRSLPCVLKSPPSLFKNIAQTLLPSMPWIIISLPACIRFSYLEWKKKKKKNPTPASNVTSLLTATTFLSFILQQNSFLENVHVHWLQFLFFYCLLNPLQSGSTALPKQLFLRSPLISSGHFSSYKK